MANYKTNTYYKDIPSILLENRIIYVTGEINEATAYQVNSMLMLLNEESSTKPIQMFIDSPGGAVISGLSIIDMMNFIEAPVYTYCIGLAASMASVLLAAGAKGNRGILSNAHVMLHQASGATNGNIQDQRIALQFCDSINSKLLGMLAELTGKDSKTIEADTSRDFYLTAEEALKYGIVDEIITKAKVIK